MKNIQIDNVITLLLSVTFVPGMTELEVSKQRVINPVMEVMAIQASSENALHLCEFNENKEMAQQNLCP